MHISQMLPGFGQIAVEGKRLLDQRHDLRGCFGQRIHARERHGLISSGERGIGGCVIGIPFNYSVEETLGFSQILKRPVLPLLPGK